MARSNGLKRDRLALLVAFPVAFALACGQPKTGGSLARRNLVVITVDTLRQDHLGSYGGTAKTPALDRLASDGFRFLDSFAVAPTTLPSHTSLFTGTYPHRHGVRLNGTQRVPAETLTLAEVLRDSGYRTAAFVGSAVLDGFYGLDQGFELYDDDLSSDLATVQKQRRAEQVARAALSWLAGAEAPFFLWAHFFDPHGPYTPPPALRPLLL